MQYHPSRHFRLWTFISDASGSDLTQVDQSTPDPNHQIKVMVLRGVPTRVEVKAQIIHGYGTLLSYSGQPAQHEWEAQFLGVKNGAPVTEKEHVTVLNGSGQALVEIVEVTFPNG